MLNYNKVILCGVVCNTPDLRKNGNGTSVTNFTLKTIEKWKNRKTGDIKTYSKYHKIVVWGKDAENAVKFVKKNVIVLIEGCLNYHKYVKDGQEKNIAEIKASNIEFRGAIKQRDSFKKNEFQKKENSFNEPLKRPIILDQKEIATNE
jgi:single-strand DNA-binding protein